MNYEGRRLTQNYTRISKEEGERRMLEGYKRQAELNKLRMFDINNNNTTPTKQQKLNDITKELAKNISYKSEIQGQLDLKNKELKDEQDDQVIKDIRENIERLLLERTELTDKINSLSNDYLSLRKEVEAEQQGGGKRKSKRNSKKVAKKPVASQKKQSIYKEILGKQMKIYKMPDSRKEYVKYKGDLHLITDYKDLIKQKAIAKTKTKVTKVTKVKKATQQKAKSKTKK